MPATPIAIAAQPIARGAQRNRTGSGLLGKQENGRILLQIKDRAGGIPPERIDRVFEPFFTTKGAGTGLGLSVCFAVIRQAGGMLSVRNAADGAIFEISLPLSASPAGTASGRRGKSLVAPG